MEELGARSIRLFLSQLAPELMDIMIDYSRVIFVDAHVYENMDDLHCAPVVPEYAPATFTHHLTPAALLALLKTLYQAEPTGRLVSIRGYDFDFHRNLSEKTGALVGPAADCIFRFLK